jgi:hypothetical protein
VKIKRRKALAFQEEFPIFIAHVYTTHNQILFKSINYISHEKSYCLVNSKNQSKYSYKKQYSNKLKCQALKKK